MFAAQSGVCSLSGGSSQDSSTRTGSQESRSISFLPLPPTDSRSCVTSCVSGPNSCEWSATGSAACLLFLNIAALPACTQQFLPVRPRFSPSDSLTLHLDNKAFFLLNVLRCSGISATTTTVSYSAYI